MSELLFAIPDQAEEKNHYEFGIPHLGSLILTHSWNGEVKGLKAWPADQRAPVWPVFFAFRIMVGIALLMFAVMAAGWILRLRGRLYDAGWYLRLCQWFAPARLRCRADGLDDDRGRPAALDGVRPVSHRRLGHSRR